MSRRKITVASLKSGVNSRNGYGSSLNLNGVARTRITDVAVLADSEDNHNNLSLRPRNHPSRVATGDMDGVDGAGMDNKMHFFQFQKEPEGFFCIIVRYYMRIMCNVQ